MEKNQPVIKPEQIFEIALRRRWSLIVPLLIAAIAGCYLAVSLPKVYESTTSILVQPQKVPGNYVKSIVSVSINERISTISQQILSRTNLEKIIERFRLFSEPEYAKMFLEEKIEDLRKRIHIKTKKARHSADAFTISFQGREPERVMQVTNALATYFMDENLKLREAQAVGTSDFLDSELEKTKKKLEEHEQLVSNYRIRYLGSLPEELGTNLRALDRLQEQLNLKQSLLMEIKGRLASLETQMTRAKEIEAASLQLSPNPVNPEPGEVLREPSENERKLKNAREKLELLLTRYTHRHPDVIRLRKITENLQKQVDKEAKTAELLQAGKEKNSSPSVVLYNDKLDNSQKPQIEGLNLERDKIQGDIEKIEKKMEIYQQRVEATPKREQELLSLKRDYGNIQDTYNSLLARKLEAEIAVNMEKKQKGEQFRVIDSARLPEKPISPNLKVILVLSLMVGLGIGCGIVFLLEFFDTSLRTREEIESYLALPVLATVPLIREPKDIIKSRVNMVLSLMALGISIFFITALVVLTIKGVDQTMAFVGRYISLHGT